MRTYLLYFFACLRLSDINVKPIKKEERHHYSFAKVVFLFQKNAQQSEKNSHYTKFGKNQVYESLHIEINFVIDHTYLSDFRKLSTMGRTTES